MWGQLPRVEALHASTLGYEIATPTELLHLIIYIPRVACFARNPGLGKRNSYRVAAACVSPSPNPPKSPSPALPKGREPILAVFKAVGWNALPLGRVGEGL